MKAYAVTITETLRKTVWVEAESSEEAEQIATDGWHAGEYILDADHFFGVEFEVRNQEKLREGYER